MPTATNKVHTGVEFLAIPQAWTLINPTPEAITFQWAGETRTIPSSEDIVLPHPKYPDVPCSAKDEHGDYIPGTLILADVRVKGRGGQELLQWSAREAIEKVLGVDVKNKTYTRSYALKGLSALPENPQREDAEEVRRQGFERYRIWRIKEARATLAKLEFRNEALARAGLKPREASAEYAEAKAIVDAANVADREKAEKQLALVIGKKGFSEPLPAPESQKDDRDAKIEQLEEKLGDLTATMADLVAKQTRPSRRKTAKKA